MQKQISEENNVSLMDIYSEVNKLDPQNLTHRSNTFLNPSWSDFLYSRSSTIARTPQPSRNPALSRHNTTLTQSSCFTHSTNFRRKGRKSRKVSILKLLKKEWEIPELPRLPIIHTSYNALDNLTIYNKKQYEHNEILYRPASPLPPLEGSRHYTEQGPDPQGIQEKDIVIKDHMRTTEMRRFEKDRAVIPTVYPDFFESSTRKRSYINDMYVNTLNHKGTSSMECFVPKDERNQERCQYCDVIGNKYCSFCIESKNRNFARGYENSFVPIRKDVREDIVRASTEGPFFKQQLPKLQSTK